jgi:two-component system chemotaxis sensor kinase CheA
VDSLLGEFQTVIKPLGKIFQQIKGISGATILGNGNVAVILDVPNLVQKAGQQNNDMNQGRTIH